MTRNLIFSTFFLCLFLTSCTKSLTDPDYNPGDPTGGTGGTGTMAYELSLSICNDESGNIYWTNSGNELIRLNGSSGTINNLGQTCLKVFDTNPITVFNGVLTAYASTSTNSTYSKSVQSNSANPALCSSSIDYNFNFGSYKAQSIHTNYHGGIFVSQSLTNELYYKPAGQNQFASYGPHAKDVACDRNKTLLL